MGGRRLADHRGPCRRRRSGPRRRASPRPGPIDLPTGTVSPINITAWQRFPIVDRVAATGGRCRYGWAATGCAWRWASSGAGRVASAQFLLGMVVSTGVGRRAGARRRALRRSHRQRRARRPRRRRPERCAVHVRRPRLRRDDRRAVRGWRSGPASTVGMRPPRPMPRSWPTAANAGDAVALRAFDRGATAVAAMIASVGAVCDLDLVVIGGGVAKSGVAAVRPAA